MLGTEPQLVEKYVNNGQLKIVFWPVLDHGQNSLNPAAAAHCAGLQNPDFFWIAHDQFFADQRNIWSGDRAYFLDTAVAAGAERSVLEACYDGGEAHALVNQLDEARLRQGIRQRPTFDLNGFLFFGSQPLSVFDAYIADALP